jgi:hypothetical protein
MPIIKIPIIFFSMDLFFILLFLTQKKLAILKLLICMKLKETSFFALIWQLFEHCQTEISEKEEKKFH